MCLCFDGGSAVAWRPAASVWLTRAPSPTSSEPGGLTAAVSFGVAEGSPSDAGDTGYPLWWTSCNP